MGSLDRVAFDTKIDSLLSTAEANIPQEILPDLPFMKRFPDVHEWHDFELKLWAIGEEIRQAVSSYKHAFNDRQIERILHVCLDKRAKRGRQSFIMLLGRKQYCNYSNVLIPLLDDGDVNGHVIDTLYKMQADGYGAFITPFLNHRQTWIRNAAKKYIQKFCHSE